MSRCSSKRKARPDDDPQVAAIKKDVVTAIGVGDYARAEDLLRRAFDADVAIARRAQDVANRRLMTRGEDEG
jgi:hypothetical protein